MERREIDVEQLRKDLGLSPGDIYEDCFYHPVLCVGVDYEDDEIWGISLIDGSQPRSCSLAFCGVRKLTVEEAWKIKTSGPLDADAGNRIEADRRWW